MTGSEAYDTFNAGVSGFTKRMLINILTVNDFPLWYLSERKKQNLVFQLYDFIAEKKDIQVYSDEDIANLVELLHYIVELQGQFRLLPYSDEDILIPPLIDDNGNYLRNGITRRIIPGT